MNYCQLLNQPFWIIRSGLWSLLFSLMVLPFAALGSPTQPTARPQRPAFTPAIAPVTAQAAPEFSDVGRPRRRQGGGSRGACLIADRPPLTALLPDSATGFTLAASPAFWFYLPYSLTPGTAMEFVLKDSQDNLVYRETLASQTGPGLINLRLPQTVALATDQSYEWYLLVQCDPTNAERFVFVNGAIRRLDRPDLQQQLATLPAAARPEFYLSQNIWYDALDSQAAQVQADPQNSDIRKSWQELLQSIGLTELAAEPILACCKSGETP